jgi:UDP-GlcNAc:undecaprenyl-phosphate/decaprenyl-phosphate GlcNAc-1-phosphate transferase
VSLLPYAGVLLASAVTVAVATPVVRLLARRFGAIDRPSDRKVHPRPTPTLGGLAIWLGILAGLGVASATPAFDDVFELSSEPFGVALAGTVIVALGVYDDLRGLAAPAKIAGQVLAGGILILFGVQLVYFWLPGLGILSLSPDLAVPLTLLWVLAMVNAVNLIDGLDGLAAGVVAIAAGAFFVYAFQAAEPVFAGATATPVSPAALFSVVVIGAVVGFLPYNFNPARIFMGDSGSMLLGVVLAAATVSGVGRTTVPTNPEFAALALPVLIPLLVLAVPFTDVVLAVIRRLRRGRPIFRPDKEHIHHRLLEIGHSHRSAVLLMYLWSALIAGSALAITFVRSRGLALALLGAIAVILIGTAVPRVFMRNGKFRGKVLRASPEPTGANGDRTVSPRTEAPGG